ncbi:hypothetical protein J6590_032900 [Homalodisca vitripennis]|nr:hypothetical protein J6590_084475 [Homalodisca vitripennis]KAG8311928.1 hypothetical protein J6590_032900 [Homalodisca vitripennis]
MTFVNALLEVIKCLEWGSIDFAPMLHVVTTVTHMYHTEKEAGIRKRVPLSNITQNYLLTAQ